MSTFDLEAAKRGEPVEFKCFLTKYWEQVKFVGSYSDGSIAMERGVGNNCVINAEMVRDYLRMAPKKIKVRYRVGMFSELGGRWLALAESDIQAEFWEKSKKFKEWLTDWQEAEVEQ